MSEANAYSIAIIGMAGRFPGAQDIAQFWEKLCAGENCISVLTEEQLLAQGVHREEIENPNYVRAAPVLQGIENFDGPFFGITPREADLMDPQHRLFLECCWEALENAGYNPTVHKSLIGVFAGARTNTYLFNLFSHQDMVNTVGMFHLGLGNDLGFLTTRVSHVFNLQGPSCAVHTACSTSLVAVHLACQSLLLDECRMALAGGIAVNVPHAVGYMYEEGSVQSPDGCCRAFDMDARGTVFGSGAGVVVLKRLDDAIADRDCIHAVIRGSAINNDGSNKASFTAPSVEGQVRVIREALLTAGLSPSDINYIECHGTGTLLGDAIEVRALSRVFGRAKPMSCALGSVKANVGHLDAAAGITGLIKVILSLKNEMLPPTVHFQQPNPQIDFESTPFHVNTAPLPWKATQIPRRAGISAFGVGGTNAHIVLEEPPQQAAGKTGRSWQLFPISARTPVALKNMAHSLAVHLIQHPEQDLSDVGYTLHVGRQRFACRQTVTGQQREELVQLLEMKTEDPETDSTDTTDLTPPVAFLFPGQGAQQENMGKELYEEEAVFRSHFDRCSEVLQPHIGQDLRKLLWEVDSTSPGKAKKELDQTWLAQPALMAIEYSLAQMWMSWGVRPTRLMGHSVGEYTAACIAGVMTLEEALAVVAARGRLMQQCPPGAMLAVGLGKCDIEQELSRLSSNGVEISGLNAPDLCTVAGRKDAIEKFEEHLRARCISYQRLHTSHAFHCSLVESAEALFLEEVKKVHLKRASIPFVSNVSGRWASEEVQDPRYWVKQMRAAVHLDDGLNEVMREPGQILLEVGPGQSLRRLALRQAGAKGTRLVLSSLKSEVAEGKSTLEALGRMWEAGIEVNWESFHRNAGRRRVPLPTYPFERRRHWIEPAQLTAASPARDERKIRKNQNISEWFWVPSWKASKLAAQNHPTPAQKQTWMILAGDLQVEVELARILGQRHQRVICVREGEEVQHQDENLYLFNPESAPQWRHLLQAVQTNGEEVTRFVFVPGSVKGAAQDRASIFEYHQRNGLYRLLGLLQAIAAAKSEVQRRIWVADTHLFGIESSDIITPEKAGLLSLCRIGPQEINGLECNLIDLGQVTPGAMQDLRPLIEEIMSDTSDPVVALRGKHRWVQTFEQVPLPSERSDVRKLVHGGVYMITGGMGAVGLLIAESLVNSWDAKVVLVGRSLLPSMDECSRMLAQQPTGRLASRLRILTSLDRHGAKIEMLQADASNREQMRRAVEHCYEKFGSLDGVIHAAGITQGSTIFCSIEDLDQEAFAIQAQPKMHGLYILSEVLRGRSVPFVAAVSSNAAVLGGLGLAAYAAANGLMDSFVAEQAEKGGPTAWISMNWDHWPEETKHLTQYHTSLDEYAMTREEALEATDRILRKFDLGQIIVATGNLQARMSMWTGGTRSAEQPNTAISKSAGNPRPAVKTVYVKPRTQTEEQLAEIWKEFLGLERVGIHDNFFELGGHSLMATRMVAQIRSSMHVEIPLANLFEGPTVAQMSEVLAQFTERRAASGPAAD